MLPHQAAMTHHLTHHDPIFLLHKALIPFLIGTSPREGKLLTHAIGGDFLIDKLPAVIGIEAQDRETGRALGRAGELPALPLSHG